MELKDFEAGLQSLEKIVSELESEGLSLEDSLKKFEEGIRLSRALNQMLDEAERKVELLIGQPDGQVEFIPFPEESGE
ncbi:exodeoxyribonuclease VII small subunit [Thermosulfuriphilus ammonigenes]|uniref:Exodeoxyribonuclease 7 small subunit n=1 Tax=Thermosulfuriphilus ammonigenes TaxID=1936021 RepID=A0A6G7PUS2_9BACT|nr:exodeoxyribonuclease VII small subunit [Thermosulfuriphilus ammonigenes]MBA2848589.1 exodeoxyribonuclease VII small subunit [Thermosulfuriphilus ammonigenes]QIJ71271.1 exodeoxyribonuclease VII small subunit [Thermosulfuriphilus ammonigenes]HFB83781.1 exodeoxyribonuclease VII small subunit [Thermodesulfatator sp.]